MSSRFTELTQFTNEMDVVLKFFDLGMKIQDFNIKIPRNVVDDFGL